METKITRIQLYSLLREKLGDEATENLINYIEYRIEERITQKSVVFATKGELNEMNFQLIKWTIIIWMLQFFIFLGLILLLKHKIN